VLIGYDEPDFAWVCRLTRGGWDMHMSINQMENLVETRALVYEM